MTFQIKIGDSYEYLARRRRRKPAELFYLYYARDEGFRTNEFNGACQPCAVRLPHGFASLPSLNGLVFFEPERTIPDLPGQSPAIDRVDEQDEIRQLSEIPSD